MADFTKSFKITVLGNEGGYNPGIGEKETYSGIDRGANPGWAGWKTVDAVKAAHPGANEKLINGLLSATPGLQTNIANFYKENYWDTVRLDKVNDQQLANNLFDCSVNQGEGLARIMMQQACNKVITDLHSAMKLLVVDQVIGPATLNAINSLSAPRLMAAINALREDSYRLNAGFAEWGGVWLKRLVKYT